MTENSYSSELAKPEEIISYLKRSGSFENLHEILDALPYLAAILNPKREVIYSNPAFRELGKASSLHQIKGLKPGEILGCVNAVMGEDGCGSAHNCAWCGLVNTFLKSQKTNASVSDECKISAEIGKHPVSLDFSVHATPFHWDGNDFILLTLIDISSEKRRKALERIFFHDILNTAGNLSGIIEMMQTNEDPNITVSLVKLAHLATTELMEEITEQRQLTAAENNELATNFSEFMILEPVDEAIRQLSMNINFRDKEVLLDNKSENTQISTDKTILRRVIINMLKNALEASDENHDVTIATKLSGKKIRITVHNHSFMPLNIQAHVFHRSFSTKGSGRGLGAYSIRLLSEKYLHGKVSFKSTEEEGTEFTVELPLAPPEE
jgi:hypothetical protein